MPPHARFYVESLSIRRELGDPHGIAFALERFAALASVHRQPERALHLAGAAASLRQDIGTPLYPSEVSRLERRLKPARQALGPAAEAAWLEGTEMGMVRAVDFALTDEEAGVQASAHSAC